MRPNETPTSNVAYSTVLKITGVGLGRWTKISFANYKPRLLITTIVGLWFLCYWILSSFWQYGLLHGTSPVLSVAFLLWVYDKLLWKFPVFNCLVKTPNLNGEYEGTVEYHWDGKDRSKNCNLYIQQTASLLKIKCYFEKKEKMKLFPKAKTLFLILMRWAIVPSIFTTRTEALARVAIRWTNMTG